MKFTLQLLLIWVACFGFNSGLQIKKIGQSYLVYNWILGYSNYACTKLSNGDILVSFQNRDEKRTISTYGKILSPSGENRTDSFQIFSNYFYIPQQQIAALDSDCFIVGRTAEQENSTSIEVTFFS